MHEFIDTHSWPLIYLHMPEQVKDEEAAARLAQITALYAHTEPFALLMDGAELPRHSAQFMSAYVRWSRDHFELLQASCVGAIRIETDNARRRIYEEHLQARPKPGQAPYPYQIVATYAEAERQARVWLAARAARDGQHVGTAGQPGEPAAGKAQAA